MPPIYARENAVGYIYLYLQRERAPDLSSQDSSVAEMIFALYFS